MGSKGSSGTNTVTSNSAPPAAVMANYQSVTQQAQNVAATPYQAYTGQEVAPLNAQQTAAGTEASNAVGAYQPYFNTAQGMISQGTQPITPTTVNAADINQYMSPYNTSVINATEAQMNQNDQTQQQQLTGNAIAAGAFGGDRAAVAASTLAGQQDLANNQTIAGLENQNYTQALGEANTQQQTGMTAQQANAANLLQGSGLTGALGNYSETNQLNAASANEAAGQVAQGTTQAADTAAYQQFEQALQYPFQTTGWLAGIDTGTGGASGGTSSTTSPGPSLASQVTGLGEFGLGAYGAATSGNKRGGPIRGYASGGSPSDDMPNFSVSYVPNAPSFGSGSSLLKPSGSQSTTTGQPQQSPMALQLAGKGLGHLLGPSGSSGASGPSAGIAQTSLGPEQVGVEYPVADSAVPAAAASSDVGIGSGIAGSLGIDGGANAGFMADITGAGDWGADGLMGDLAGASGFEGIDAAADAGIMGGIDAGVAEGALDAGVADAGLATAGEAAMDVAPAIMFAKRGGPIKGYASGGTTSTSNYPLTYLLQNPTLGSNINSVMGGGYGGALSGLGPTSPGYASGGGIMPKKYASAGFVPPPPMNSGGIGTGNVGDSVPYMAINNVPGMGYDDPTSGFNWGNTPSNYTPMPTQSMASAPSAQGIPSAPSISGSIADQSANSPWNQTTGTDNSGTTTIAGVPALGSSTSGQPQDLTDLEAKLQANAPVLDKNEALMRAGLATMAGTNPHALSNIGAGGLQGVEDYSQQKQAVRDYGLKEAEVEDRAKQMQVEADRFKSQQDLAEKNFESEADLRKAQAAYMTNGKESTSNREWDTFNSDPANAGLSPTEKIQKYNQATAKPSPTQSAGLANYFKSPDIAQNALTNGKVDSTDLTPEANAKVERLLAGGNPTAISSRQDQRNDLLTIAHLRDPSYNENEYATRAAVEKANTGAGQIGKEYASFNTIMQHGPMVIQAANDLGNNGSWTPGIKLGNYIDQNLSDPRVKNLDSDIKLLAAEKAKMLSGQGVVTDAAREESNLRDYDSASELKSETMNTINQTLARARERQQQYITNMDGNDSDYIKKKADGFIQPDSRDQLKKLGIPLQNFSGQAQAATQPAATGVVSPPVQNGVINLNDPRIKAAINAGYSMDQIKQHMGIQ